ncbi:MAG: chromosome segregation protein SMC [Planctomycetes bacterium HGW-Planctomycetes-1]|nr:MAG: chromosome segregation protein SMC [Planctomycetes bacterium HGW-Planctomycetes-1]
MRLEKIVLDGFKSFADKTEFDFNQQITAIVGPNGCGKSNIVDAMKWVLGEQSTKSLRSGQMADVIFSGSAARKAMGMAQVSLHFSNASSIGAEQDELVITRRLYRSGESEYLINNKTCRLKDIREMFMDTGVGVRAYSIIEQGQISQILTTSKTDRRFIFEEAAGISKYKAQKKEALRRLEHAEQNLLRLADIVGEVQKQLRSIKLQAGKARSYLQYNQRLKELRVSFSLAQYHQIQTETGQKNTQVDELQNQLASVAAKVSQNEAKLSSLAAEMNEKENEINRCDNNLISVTGRIEQQQQKIEFLHKRIQETQERKGLEEQNIGQIQQRLEDFEQQIKESASKLENIGVIVEQKSSELEKLQEQIRTINLACAETETELQDEKTGIIDIVRHTAQLHNEIQSISVYRNNLSGQKDRLTDRVSQTREQFESLLGGKAQHQARLDDINKVIGELQQQLENKRQQINQIDRDVAQTNEQLAQAREQRSAIQSEIKVISDMEDRREGIDTAVKKVLAVNKPFIKGIIADIIRAKPKYAAAIEAALEGKADAIVADSTQQLLNDKTLAQQAGGRVRFICTDRLEPFVESIELPQTDGIIGRAVEFVSFEPQYAQLVWRMLGKTVIIENTQKAFEMASFCSYGYSFVTVEGDILNSDASFCTGPIGKASGLISRKSRLVQLTGELQQVSANISGLEEKLAAGVRENEHLEKLCKDFRTSVYEANTEKTNITSDLNVIEQNIKRLSQEQPVLTSEIQSLEKQISETVQKEYQSKQQLEELETVNSQRSQRIEQLEAQLAEKKKSLEQNSGELTELKVFIGQAQEQKKAVEQKIAGLNMQFEHGKNELNSTQNDIKSCIKQIEQSQRDIRNTETEIAEMLAQKQAAQNQSVELHQEVETMLAQRQQTEEALKQDRQRQNELDQQINQLKLELGQLQVRATDLMQRVTEELGMDLVAEYQNYTAGEMNWDAVRDEITELRGKIERLGNVNVDAIEQQEELEKRNEFLTSQIEDLNNSKNQLQQLINRLNKESMDKFAITFEQIRANFQEVFRKLFGGGKADVMLEQPEDILESGIEIIARPPGKETRSISLLSGGEKTMTAIALLFAIFKTKPSPFCFLDEVDAALDEANNERFNLIVQEFQKNSQFVIITHAKRTMSIADMLFGITMQQKGISKKISVTFDSFQPMQEEEAVAVA